jgi:predicted transcriptional regulator
VTLDEYLIERGESNDNFSKRADLGIATVSRLRNGGKPTFENLQKVHRATDGKVSFADFALETSFCSPEST